MAKEELRQMKNYVFSLFILFSLLSFAQEIESAGIYASKMNVLYKNVANPIFVGTSFKYDSVKLTSNVGKFDRFNNFRATKGKAVFMTAKIYAKDSVAITVKRAFRLKPLPQPIGMIRDVSNINIGGVSSLYPIKIEAKFPDFEFPIQLEVTEFMVKRAGKEPIKISGNKLSEAKPYFQDITHDEIIIIEGIKAKNYFDETDKTIYRPSDIIMNVVVLEKTAKTTL